MKTFQSLHDRSKSIKQDLEYFVFKVLSRCYELGIKAPRFNVTTEYYVSLLNDPYIVSRNCSEFGGDWMEDDDILDLVFFASSDADLEQAAQKLYAREIIRQNAKYSKEEIKINRNNDSYAEDYFNDLLERYQDEARDL